MTQRLLNIVLWFFLCACTGLAANPIILSVAQDNPSQLNYIKPSGIEAQLNFRFKITNTFSQPVVLRNIVLGSGTLTGIIIDNGDCCFYIQSGSATQPLAPGASCDVYLQVQTPTLPDGVTRKLYSNLFTFTVTDQLGYTETSPTFSVTSVSPSSAHQQTLFQTDSDISQYRRCKIDKSSSTQQLVCSNVENQNIKSVVPNVAGTLAYVGDVEQDTIQVCSINADNNTLENCTHTVTNLIDPVGLALSPNGRFLYVTNRTDVAVCKIAESGSLTGCDDSKISDHVNLIFPHFRRHSLLRTHAAISN